MNNASLLFRNALESLNHALEHYFIQKNDWERKFSLIHVAQAIEFIFKDILLQYENANEILDSNVIDLYNKLENNNIKQ